MKLLQKLQLRSDHLLFLFLLLGSNLPLWAGDLTVSGITSPIAANGTYDYWIIDDNTNDKEDILFYYTPYYVVGTAPASPLGLNFAPVSGSGTVTDASLPVELLSFSAAGKNNLVELQWTTASESDNLGFIIERKIDKSDWQKIASYQTDNALVGKGTTSSSSQYSYSDTDVTAGMDNDYRLSEVNINGDRNEIGTTSDKSTVPVTTQLFAVYYNPSTTLNYNLAKDSHVTLAVYNVLGRQIKMLNNQQVNILFNETEQWTRELPRQAARTWCACRQMVLTSYKKLCL